MSYIAPESASRVMKMASHVGPPRVSDETALLGAEAVEVRIFWGDLLLEFLELSPPRAFFIGDGSCRDSVDFTVPEFGVERAALLTVDEGRVTVVAPSGTHLSVGAEPGVFASSNPRTALTRASSDPFATPTFTRQTAAVDVYVGHIRFSFSPGVAERRCPRSLDSDDGVRPLAFFGASSLLVGTLTALMAYFTPPLGLTDDEDASRDRLYLMNAFLDSSAERERKAEEAAGHDTGQSANAPEAPAHGETGRVGHPAPVEHATRGSGSERGPVERPAMSRAEAISAASEFGMIGLLASGVASVNVARWDDPGVGAIAREGGLFGSDLEATGMGGLAPLGIGEGGGGKGNQIGLSSIGTCQGEECTGRSGIGVGSHWSGPGHASAGPRLRMVGNTVVSGSIPPDVIQRIVRQSFGRFRGCYEDGLRKNPGLEGRVTARFVIARDGSVGAVQSGGSDLPDARVVACVLHTYSSLTFPSPKDGIVTVTYPLSFTPSA